MAENKFNLTQTGHQVQNILNASKNTDQVLTEIQEAMADLPDGQAVSAQVAINTAAIEELSEKVGQGDGAYDISEANAVGGVLATYADLAAALGENGTNIPADLRKGGMSVKFVQSSDNKYVQYRLMADDWSTTLSDWQGVENEPNANSDNLVKSGGVYEYVTDIVKHIENGETVDKKFTFTPYDADTRIKTPNIRLSTPTVEVKIVSTSGFQFSYNKYDEQGNNIGARTWGTDDAVISGCYAFVVAIRKSDNSQFSNSDIESATSSITISFVYKQISDKPFAGDSVCITSSTNAFIFDTVNKTISFGEYTYLRINNRNIALSDHAPVSYNIQGSNLRCLVYRDNDLIVVTRTDVKAGDVVVLDFAANTLSNTGTVSYKGTYSVDGVIYNAIDETVTDNGNNPVKSSGISAYINNKISGGDSSITLNFNNDSGGTRLKTPDTVLSSDSIQVSISNNNYQYAYNKYDEQGNNIGAKGWGTDIGVIDGCYKYNIAIRKPNNSAFTAEEKAEAIAAMSIIAHNEGIIKRSVFYVDGIVGLDANIGDAEHPLKTIQAAVNKPNVNTIIVNRGIYNEAVTIDSKVNLTIIPNGYSTYTEGHDEAEMIKVYSVTISNSKSIKIIGVHAHTTGVNPYWVDLDNPIDNPSSEQDWSELAWAITNVENLELIHCYASEAGRAGGFFCTNVGGKFTRCKAWNIGNMTSTYNNFNADGFNFHGYGLTILEDCVAYNVIDDGVSHHDSTIGRMYNCECYNCRRGGGVAPVINDMLVAGCYLHDNKHGIEAWDGNLTTHYGITIQNCTIVDNTYNHYGSAADINVKKNAGSKTVIANTCYETTDYTDNHSVITVIGRISNN